MRSTGIVRNLDDVGRAVLPIEIRRRLHLCGGDPVEYLLHEDMVVIRRYDAGKDLNRQVDRFAKALELNEPMAPELTHLLMEKVKEMQEILRKGTTT